MSTNPAGIEGNEQEAFYTHYRLLDECHDASARAYLDNALDELSRKLALLADPAWRESFLDNIALHREIDVN